MTAFGRRRGSKNGSIYKLLTNMPSRIHQKKYSKMQTPSLNAAGSLNVAAHCTTSINLCITFHILQVTNYCSIFTHLVKPSPVRPLFPLRVHLRSLSRRRWTCPLAHRKAAQAAILLGPPRGSARPRPQLRDVYAWLV